MQTIDGTRIIRTQCERTSKSGKPIGNELKGCPHEEGNISDLNMCKRGERERELDESNFDWYSFHSWFYK